MPRTLTRLAGPALAVALMATGLAGPAHAATQTSRADRAAAALARAKALFDGRTGKAAAAPGRDATFVLLDLRRLRSALPAAERAEADRILARPTDGAGDPSGDGYTVPEATPVCGAHVCVHYVTTTADKVPGADGNHNGVPDFVEKTRSTLESVHKTYVNAGYRAPKSDGTQGGDARTDIYLTQTGDDGFYGYCTSDDPSTAHDVWSYCVLDNGFQHSEFPTNTPTENLQVTAAHEYYHAVQFAYDIDDDHWFMEATATWAEDELYDSVNDNRQYLSSGQLGEPYNPLDTWSGSIHYGNWIFFRYLTEKWPSSAGGMPTIVRSMWRQADGAAGAPNQYSIEAVKSVLAGKKTSFAKEFSLFTARNRFARKFYDEGSKQHYPQSRIGQTLTLGQRGFTNRADITLSHQISYSLRVKPSHVTGSRKLQVLVYLGAGHHDTSVVVDWISKKGKHTFKIVKVNAQGNGSVKVPFANAKTQSIVATAVNSSTRYTCGQGTVFSCQGTSLDDSLVIGMKFKTTP